MSNEMTFWLGLLLAVPLSIAVNLISPAIATRVARYNGSFRVRLELRKRREELMSEWLAANPNALVMHLINQRYRQISLTFGTFVSLALYVLATFLKSEDDAQPILVTCGLLGMLVFGTALVRQLTSTQRRWEYVLRRNGWVAWDATWWSDEEQRWIPIDVVSDSGPSPFGGKVEKPGALEDLPTQRGK
ncbi:hypothetical protein ACGFJ4_22750 [Micromonospora chalcea]|uniref:hypothetical protein n=1 Tax=Micromonospora chalcea TaxID=1874 RepID=UPI003715891F